MEAHHRNNNFHHSHSSDRQVEVEVVVRELELYGEAAGVSLGGFEREFAGVLDDKLVDVVVDAFDDQVSAAEGDSNELVDEP